MTLRLLLASIAIAIGGCAAAIGVLKLVFGACSHRLTMLQIHSPSGHTAMSTAIYGSLALLIGASLPMRAAKLIGARRYCLGLARDFPQPVRSALPSCD